MIRVALASAFFFLFAQALAGQTVTFTDAEVRISELSPGARLAWVALAHEPQAFMTRFVTRDGVAEDQDGDGIATIPFVFPLRTVLAAVDIDTGSHIIASPAGFTSLALQPAERFGRARGMRPSLDFLELERNEVEVLVVRPRVGAWRLLSFEGSPADADAVNDGVLTVRFADLQPLAAPEEGVPGTLKPNDVVIAIDPEDLAHFTLTVGK